jgi:hypothetical protein
MPAFEITVAVTVTMTYDIEADTESDAMERASERIHAERVGDTDCGNITFFTDPKKGN